MFVLWLTMSWCSIALAQEKPSLLAEPYTYDQIYRQDVCDLHDKYYSNQITLRDALNGFELHPLLNVESEIYFNLNEDGSIDEIAPGIVAEILDELAERAGFTWRNSFAIIDATGGKNRTYTEMLNWGTEVFDIAGNWFLPLTTRMELGIDFPEGIVDSSMIMVQKKTSKKIQKESTPILWFNWTNAFSTDVWIGIFLTIIISAFFYLIFEFQAQTTKLADSVFGMLLIAVTHFQFQPKSSEGKIIGIGVAFWSLILITTYTANLTSFFINEQISPIRTLDDVVARGLVVCTHLGSTTHEYMNTNYPNANLVLKPGSRPNISELIDGCDLALTYNNLWEVAETQKEFNENCSLEKVGDVVSYSRAGFGTKVDDGTLCTSFIRNVLNLHLVEMRQDNTLSRITQRVLKQSQGEGCITDKGAEDNENAGQLTSRELAGTFLIPVITTGAAILVYFVTFCYRKAMKNQADAKEVSSQRTVDDSWRDATKENCDLSIQQKLEYLVAQQRDFASQQESTRQAIDEILAALVYSA